jgi:hypothetical protein
MSAPSHEHAEDQVPHAHAFDSPEEVAHAKEHAVENIYWFIGFFCIILVTVANYEFSDTNNYVRILLLAAFRSLVIASFLFYLFRKFSLVFRTLTFTIVFLIGMIFLSWWDSTLPHIGDPIAIPGQPSTTNGRVP